MTDCGLPGIKQIPYGVHMCHFYSGRDELAAALVPYFAAGLRANERCIWIAAEPLNAAHAKLGLLEAGVDVAAALASGALLVRDFSQWYAEGERLRGTEVVRYWLAEEERALAQGYAGLRITGNVPGPRQRRLAGLRRPAAPHLRAGASGRRLADPHRPADLEAPERYLLPASHEANRHDPAAAGARARRR